jgi:hypothetical protein
VTPLFVVHARLFKEDISFAALLVLALAALIGCCRSRRRIAPSCSVPSPDLPQAQIYIGALILPFAVVAILLVPTPGPERLVEGLNRHRHSIGAFLLIMPPAIRRIERWRRGVNFELVHSVQGHAVPCRSASPGACSTCAKACGLVLARRSLPLASSA